MNTRADRAWDRRVRETRDESIRRFGDKPDPFAILEAIVDAAPGPTFRRYVDPLAIEFAAARAIGKEIDP